MVQQVNGNRRIYYYIKLHNVVPGERIFSSYGFLFLKKHKIITQLQFQLQLHNLYMYVYIKYFTGTDYEKKY